ncbi:glycosyltransferase family 2 protein [Arcticibacter tournemirensis]|uniref:Glycosyltransferase family 2 protein n=1 Tax=Arcticibacter tournemirensis TaxID=699437 RepID=A0A4Q0M8J0_9SPHI|nr:glycosyltransferase family 2 protein [Arcticibacter tournemirensis]RXF69414.1 glycosyltransferase family 2 protein [Arcticibacter tournemirensis]
MILISVITPAYNVSKHITETILSVQKQTYKNWEMIIVDDCSEDNTFEIISDFSKQDTRIKVFKHKKNAGVAAARNTALNQASGEYIAFVDGDDLWTEDKLEKQLAFMQANDYALTYTDHQNFDSDSGAKRKIITAPKRMRANDILSNTAIACLTVMINRKKVGDFQMPLLGHTEDNCTWYEILKKGHTAYALPECLSLYRVGNSSLTKNKSIAAKQQWNTYRKYFKFSVIKSAYYFSMYAVNAIIRHL